MTQVYRIGVEVEIHTNDTLYTLDTAVRGVCGHLGEIAEKYDTGLHPAAVTVMFAEQQEDNDGDN
jgi:hypothetical protein